MFAFQKYLKFKAIALHTGSPGLNPGTTQNTGLSKSDPWAQSYDKALSTTRCNQKWKNKK